MGSLCVDDFGESNIFTVGNDKLRSECLEDGSWSELSHECVCIDKLQSDQKHLRP